MRIKSTLLSAFILVLGFSHPVNSDLSEPKSPAPTRSAWAYRELIPGFDYASVPVANPLPESPPTTLHLFRLDLQRFKLKVLQASTWQQKLLTAEEFRKNSGALLAINSNFFDGQGKALGLVLQDGIIQTPVRPISWWACLLIQNGQARLEKISKLEGQNYEFGTQAGPRLVAEGSALKLKSETSPKTAIGIDPQGKLVLIVSEGFLEINQLAQFLATPPVQGGAGLKEALNLDGGASTQLSALVKSKAGSLTKEIPAWSRVPVGLGVFPR